MYTKVLTAALLVLSAVAVTPVQQGDILDSLEARAPIPQSDWQCLDALTACRQDGGRRWVCECKFFQCLYPETPRDCSNPPAKRSLDDLRPRNDAASKSQALGCRWLADNEDTRTSVVPMLAQKTPPPKPRGEHSGIEERANVAKWGADNVKRVCYQDGSLCQYDLDVYVGCARYHCTFNHTAPNAPQGSFYKLPCNPKWPGITVSWTYLSPAPASAILSIEQYGSVAMLPIANVDTISHERDGFKTYSYPGFAVGIAFGGS